MRTIYLIRHGAPDFPNGERFCLSRINLHLDAVGRMQGLLLKQWFAEKEVSGVFHSDLLRAQETAVFLSETTMAVEGLQEIGVGQWEGLTFQEIREKFPEIYQRRIKNPIVYRIPGGEAISTCRNRAMRALENLLKETEGDIAVVAHAGVNRILLCELLGRSLKYYLTISQPYGCVNVLQEENGRLSVKEIGIQPHPVLADEICEQLLDAANTPEQVKRHCRAVTEKATRMARNLMDSGIEIDVEKLRAAAMLHDIARTETNHAAVGAAWMKSLGYPEIADIISGHHDLDVEQEAEITETTVLYLADKLIQEDREVTLEQRFTASAKKINTHEAEEGHRRRYHQAQRVASRFDQQLRGAV